MPGSQTTSTEGARVAGVPIRIATAFLAGFVAVLVFHQLAVWLIAALGLVPLTPFVWRPVPPLGVPQVISLAFWGGVWGAVLLPAWDRLRTRDSIAMLIGAAVLGAILPTLVGWFVVAPLKGLPVAAGWNPARMWVGPVVNGAWGLGVVVLLPYIERMLSKR